MKSRKSWKKTEFCDNITEKVWLFKERVSRLTLRCADLWSFHICLIFMGERWHCFLSVIVYSSFEFAHPNASNQTQKPTHELLRLQKNDVHKRKFITNRSTKKSFKSHISDENCNFSILPFYLFSSSLPPCILSYCLCF